MKPLPWNFFTPRVLLIATSSQKMFSVSTMTVSLQSNSVTLILAPESSFTLEVVLTQHHCFLHQSAVQSLWLRRLLRRLLKTRRKTSSITNDATCGVLE